VLAVILAIIAASGAVSVGVVLMIAFGLGLGLPFLALAVFSGALTRVPSGGPWMEIVKVVLATAMFVVALYFLGIAWPTLGKILSVPEHGLVAAVLGLAGVGLVAAYLKIVDGGLAKALKVVAVLVLTSAASLVVVGGESPPVGAVLGRGGLGDGAVAPGCPGGPSCGPAHRGPAITWSVSHDPAVERARRESRPVMIDFGAEWCQACKELERITYVDPRVVTEAQRFVAVKLDATEIDGEMQKLFDRYHIVGLPTVIFIDSTGTVLASPRVTGFVAADRFAELMAKVR
jgi:thiol:disulfide interchange protein DsbD